MSSRILLLLLQEDAYSLLQTVAPNTSPQFLVPAAPEESKLTREGCPIKEGQRYKALNVSSSPQPNKTGNGSSEESQCGKNEKKDESLSVEPKRSDEV